MADRNSVQAKKDYLNEMSQHFKQIAERQNNKTKKIIANTFSKNAEIMEDLYSQIERLSIELRDTRTQIEQLRSMIKQLSEIKQNGEKEKRVDT